MSKNKKEQAAQPRINTNELKKQLPALSLKAEMDPANANHWSDLGVALRLNGKLNSAVALYRRAMALEPNSAAILSNLGGALRATGELEEAIEVLQKAVKLSPGFSAAQFNLGVSLEDAGRLEEALMCFDTTLAENPTRRDAIEQKAFTLLRLGRFEEGLKTYEKRLLIEERLKRNFSQPAWDGNAQKDKTLLLYSEQGRGDTLQFIRYASPAKALVNRIIVECPPELSDLTSTADGVDEVIHQGQQLPPFDFQASLMSLPFIFGTRLDSIPGTVPYLSVPKPAFNKVELKRSNLFKIGIVWASGHSDLGAHQRSTELLNFLCLCELPEVSLYSLQVGPASTQLQELGCDYFIQDLGPQLKSFADTADAIRQLDLVVSVDTAVVHVAGALNKPVWVLLPYASEWRWLQERTDTPWYPSAKLIRQNSPFAWTEVFERVVLELRELLDSRKLAPDAHGTGAIGQ